MSDTRSAELSAAARRITSLDGLRGAGSVIVVFHHLSLTLVPFSDLYFDPSGPKPAMFSVVWFLTYTPFQILVGGAGAVLVFFVLSGLVLTRPVLTRAKTDWLAYFPSRLMRLYLPAIGSVLLATVVLFAVSCSSSRGTTRWTELARVDPPRPGQILNGFDLLFGDKVLNNPLWTLQWEVLFSLMLPIYVLVARVVARWAIAAAAGCVAVIVLGYFIPLYSLVFLPVFFLGSLVAVRYEDIEAWVAKVGTGVRGTLIGAGALAASLVLLTVDFPVSALLGVSSRTAAGLVGLSSVGAVGLVLVSAFWWPMRALLSTAVFRWLATVSFSLYLVHVPIIAALDALFPPGYDALRLVVSLAAALIVAALFSRFVEWPSHRLARRVSLSILARPAPATAP